MIRRFTSVIGKPIGLSVDHRRHLSISIALLVLLLLVGAVGFHVLGDHLDVFQLVCLTALILTTVGMKEVGIDLNPAQQVWALMTMLMRSSASRCGAPIESRTCSCNRASTSY